MIENFTKSALMVFPYYEDYRSRNTRYKTNLNNTVRNISTLLKKSGVELHYFVTDDVAQELTVKPDKWAVTLNRGDMFFVSNNCVGIPELHDNAVYFDDVYEATVQTHAIDRTMSVERRFEITLKRESSARTMITKRYKFVIYVKQSKMPAIRVTPKAGSGILYLEITNVNFLATCYMSDMKMDVADILGVKNGNMPVYEWEVG